MILNKLLNSNFKNPEIPKKLFVISVLAGIFFLGLRASTDPDLFWHLKTGELMWQYHTIPNTDWFSYTMNDYTWVDYEWLTEILMFLIYKISGFGGLAIIFALIITLTFGYLIPESIPGHPFFLTRFFAILGAFVSSLTFGSRPQMLSLLGVALLFFIIAKYKENPQGKIIWLLPIIFLFWANMHPSFVFGIGFLAIFLALENLLIKQKERVPGADWLKLYVPLGREAWKKFARLSVLSVFLTFVNPYTWRVYQIIYQSLTDTYNKNIIMEWLAPNFHTTAGLLFGFYVIFIFIILAIIKKIDLLSFVFIPLMLFLAFQAGRNIPLFVIVSIPFLVKALPEFENIFSDIFRKKFIAIAMSGFLIFYLPLNMDIASTVKTFGNADKQAEIGGYPAKALNFLLANPEYRRKNILNSYVWGGYIIGSAKCKVQSAKLWCEPKVFIDGRMDYWKLPDRHILKDYADIINFSDNWENLVKKYDVQIIFFDKKTAFVHALKFNGDWKKIYEDDVAVLYEKIHD